MAAIAERLFGTLAARAPEVGFAFFYLDAVRFILCGLTLAHVLCVPVFVVRKKGVSGFAFANYNAHCGVVYRMRSNGASFK